MFGSLSTASVFVCLAFTLTTDAMLDPPSQRRPKGDFGGHSVCVIPPINLTDFKEDALRLHNRYREGHAVRALEITDWLNNIAQDLANRMAANDGLLKESRGGKYGESFYMTSDTSLTVTEVVEQAITSWYSESNSYDYKSTKYSPKTRHFTQMLWQDTQMLGVGFAESFNNRFCACTYYPPGNTEPRFPQPINPPQ